MRFNIKTTISLDTNQAEHLKQVIEPENRTAGDHEIQTWVKENQVVTTIEGKMTLGSLLRSVDDILQTAILSEAVAKTDNTTQ